MEGVVGDGRHLEHVLAARVDQWVVRIHVTRYDRVAPVDGEHVHDRIGLLGRAPVDQLPIVVVVEGDVLRLAECLERAIPVLHSQPGHARPTEETDPDDREHHPQKIHPPAYRCVHHASFAV